jgi:hypothetical protein
MVSMMQSRGRARMADSSFVVMSEQHNLPMEHLLEAERLQNYVIQKTVCFCLSMLLYTFSGLVYAPTCA